MEDKNENVETTEPTVTEPVQEEVKEETEQVTEEKVEEPVEETPVEETVEEKVEESAPESLTPPSEVVKSDSIEDSTPAEEEVQIEHEQPSMQMEPHVTSTEPAKKQGNGKVVGLIIAGVVVFLLVLGILIPPLLLFNKKQVVDKEITTVFNSIKKTLKEVDKNSVEYDFDRDAIGVEGTLTISSDYKTDEIDLSKLKDYALSYQGAIDKKGNKASASLKLSNKKPILDVVAMMKAKEVYVSLGDILDKTIVAETEEEIKDLELNTLTTEDIEVILNSTEKTIKNSIEKKDITKEKETKEINGKKGKYTKISYELSVGDTNKAILNGYLEDDKVLDVLSKATSQDKKDVKKAINDMIDSMGKPSNDQLKVNLYTSGLFPKTKELELVADETVFTIDYDKNLMNYSLKDGKEDLGSGTYDKSKKVFTYEQKQKDYKITAEVNFKDPNKVTGNATLKADGLEISVDIEAENKTSGKSTSNDIKVKLNYKSEEDKFKVELNSNSKITVGAKVEEVKTKDAVKVDELTEEDVNKAYNALYEKLFDVMNDIYPGFLEQYTDVNM